MIAAILETTGGVEVAELSVEQVRQLAEIAGIEIDESQLEAVASRLGRILAELDRVTDEELSGFEPVTAYFPAAHSTDE